jgi:hypothetical protein
MPKTQYPGNMADHCVRTLRTVRAMITARAQYGAERRTGKDGIGVSARYRQVTEMARHDWNGGVTSRDWPQSGQKMEPV